MLPRRTLCWLGLTVFEFALVGPGTGQSATPAARAPAPSAPIAPAPRVRGECTCRFGDPPGAPPDRFNAQLQTDHRDLHPAISEQRISGQKAPEKSFKGDDYFLSRLDLTGNFPVTVAFADPGAYERKLGKAITSDSPNFHRSRLRAGDLPRPEPLRSRELHLRICPLGDVLEKCISAS